MASTRTTPGSPRTVRSIPKGIDDNKHLFGHDLTNLEVTDLTIGGEIVLGAGTVGLTLTTTAATPAEVLRFSTLRAGADGDVQRISFRAWDSNNVLQEYAQINAQLNDVTAATLDSSIELACMVAGTMTTVFDSNVSSAGVITSTFPVGDTIITDGSLSMTDADNATTFSVTNDTITTADMVDINSGSLTTGSLIHLTLDTSALITTGRALEITANAATTSTGIISVSGTALTDGWVSQLTGGGVSATALGGVLDIVAGASTLGSAIRVVSTGAATSTTVGHLLQLQDDSNALGIGVHATFDGLTTGEGVLLTHTTSVIADGGSLLRLSDSGINTGGATNGTVLDVQASGQLAGTVALVETIVTTGTAVEINSTGAYTGTAGVLAVNGINSTTGDLVVFTGGGAGQSTAAGSVLQVNNAGATNGSDLEINHSTGVYTGTKGIFDLDANAATTGTIANINADGLTEGTALYISATEATLTSGFYLEFFDGAANDFTVGRYGATVIAGLAAGTNALTLTTGDATISSGDFVITAGNASITESATSPALTLTRTEDAASVQVGIFEGNRATPADNDLAFLSFLLSDSAGNQDEGARISWQATTVLNGATQDCDLILHAMNNNVLATVLTLDGSASTANFSWGISLAGITSPDLGTVTTIDINGGTLDGVSIGATTPAAAIVSTLSVTGTDIILDSDIANTGTLRFTTGAAAAVITLPNATGTLYSTVASSISSAQMLSSMSDETGTGLLVFATSPTLTTPVIGAATGTSLVLTTPLGTTPVGTVTIQEFADGRDVTTVLTLTNFIVGGLAGAAAALGVGNIVYAFPAGQHFELVSSLSSIVLTAAGTAVTTDTGLGSVIASGAISILSGTATFEDRLTGQAIATAAGGGAAVSALTAATAGIGTGISLNVAASVKNVFLNSAGTWNVDNTGDLTATGTVVLKWTRMQ